MGAESRGRCQAVERDLQGRLQNYCDAYQAKVTADPDSIGDGSAKRVAFDAWFGNRARVAGYNESSVNDMIP